MAQHHKSNLRTSNRSQQHNHTTSTKRGTKHSNQNKHLTGTIKASPRKHRPSCIQQAFRQRQTTAQITRIAHPNCNCSAQPNNRPSNSIFRAGNKNQHKPSTKTSGLHQETIISENFEHLQYKTSTMHKQNLVHKQHQKAHKGKNLNKNTIYQQIAIYSCSIARKSSISPLFLHRTTNKHSASTAVQQLDRVFHSFHKVINI